MIDVFIPSPTRYRAKQKQTYETSICVKVSLKRLQNRGCFSSLPSLLAADPPPESEREREREREGEGGRKPRQAQVGRIPLLSFLAGLPPVLPGLAHCRLPATLFGGPTKQGKLLFRLNLLQQQQQQQYRRRRERQKCCLALSAKTSTTSPGGSTDAARATRTTRRSRGTREQRPRPQSPPRIIWTS
jgi:hypothetical protein